MSHLRYSLLAILIIQFLISVKTNAQKTNQEFRLSIYQSKVTEDPSSSGNFFNTTSLGIEYQYKLIKNLNGLIEVRFLQFIETKGNNKDPGLKKLERFSKSFLTFDAGISLIPLVINDTFEIRFNPGISLRHRNLVRPHTAVLINNGSVLVANNYQNRWDIGGRFQLAFSYTLKNNWLIELRGQFHTYDKGSGVFDVGLSFGRKF